MVRQIHGQTASMSDSRPVYLANGRTYYYGRVLPASLLTVKGGYKDRLALNIVPIKYDVILRRPVKTVKTDREDLEADEGEDCENHERRRTRQT
jgi:hypothetical protein